jgi:RNA polymerase sigma-70 factor (ECF subfamily)
MNCREAVSPRTDEQLVAAYQQSGCREALDELVRRHLRKVRALVRPMVLDEATTDDVCQEVFLRVVRSLPGFNGRSRFSTWLYRITLNAARSHLRHRPGRELRGDPSQHAGRLPGASAPAEPDAALLRAELETELAAALADLSPKLRAAIALTSIGRMAASEAAAVEGCSTATMYWRIHKARKLLERRLGKYLSS